jgi:hypothetical protein
MAVVLLLSPLTCFAAGAPKRQAEECCLKGKCAPTANSDECCKHTSPDRNQLAPTKAADQSSPLIAVLSVQTGTLIHTSTFQSLGELVKHPPPRLDLAVPSLPLLI